MTTPDLGAERPQTSDTRRMGERSLAKIGAHVSDRGFLIALAVIVVVIGLFALVLWL